MSDDLVTKVKMALESDLTPRVFHIRSVDALALVSCIKALTAERDRLSVSNMQMLGDIAVAMGRIEQLTAERDRLRAALKAIAAGVGEDFDEATQQNVTAWMSDEDMQEIARAALNGEINE